MMRFFILFFVFCAGGNFERFMAGGTDWIFGTHWMLAVYSAVGVFAGAILIRTLSSGNRNP